MSAVDHRRTYVKAAAVHAASAIARLLDCREPKDLPRLRELELAELNRTLFQEGDPVLTVFADLMGAVTGQAGIVIYRDGLAELLDRLVGDGPHQEIDEPCRSALCEVGNIAVSAAAGALGHLAGGVVVPSVPRLASSCAAALGVELSESELEHLPVYLVDWEYDELTPVRMSFVWIPSEP